MGLKPPDNPRKLHIKYVGVQGDGFAVPLHNILSAVAGWLHGSEDSMSWITSGSFFDFQNSFIPNYLA